MDKKTFELNQFLNDLDRDQIILTPNSRLRRWLLKCLGAGDNSVQKTPSVFAIQDWIIELWRQLQDQGWEPITQLKVISANSRLKLWRDIILNAEVSQSMINPELLAKQADQAYTTLQQWCLDLSALGEYQAEDNDVFVSWARQFEIQCQALQFISNEDRIVQIQTAFEQGQLAQLPSIDLLAFDDVSPLLQQLLKSASNSGTHLKVQQKNNRSKLLAFDNRQLELKACAEWAHQLLSSNRKKPIKIGIIDPSLGQDRNQIEQVFIEVFEPQFLFPNSPRYTLPFNFSAGTPLAETPIINAALQLLQLNHPLSDTEQLVRLLHSGFWGDKRKLFTELKLADASLSEHFLRKQQQQTVRSNNFQQATAKALSKLPLEHLEQQDETYRSYNELLQNHRLQRRGLPLKASAKYWSQSFFNQLQQLGWPGHRRLDSNEYQQISQLYQLLEELHQLDSSEQLLSWQEALKALSDLAHSRHYQAKSEDSPVQIFGVLEAAGIHFDHCWVLGMHAQQWPPKPKPSALLPFELQQQHHMPHATAERELKFAQSLTESFLHCATEVIFSYPLTRGDEELLASPLMKNLSKVANNTPGSAPILQQESSLTLSTFKQQLLNQRALHWVDCRQAPPISEQEITLGGSAVLQQQASCPFNAFAIYRLGARYIEPPILGLSPIERGNILHLAMELIWREIKDHSTLLSTSKETLSECVAGHINTAIASILSKRFDLGPNFRDIEQQRLQALILNWLEIERDRAPFEVIAIESTATIRLDQLELTLRLDRLDKMIDSPEPYLMVIDYKTGEPDVKYWQGPKMQEPQLPLYTLSNTDIKAISFAQINIKANAFKGMGAAPLADASILDCENNKYLQRYQLQGTWQDICQQWQHDLEALAHAYCSGLATLSYKDITAQRYSEHLDGLQRNSEIQHKHLLLQSQPEWIKGGEV